MNRKILGWSTLLLAIFLINAAFLYNLKNLTYVNYYLLLLVINLDILVLVTSFAVILRKLIKIYVEGKAKLRVKLANVLMLFLFVPILLLNVTIILFLLQSTKSYISGRTTDMSAKAQKLYSQLVNLEKEKLKEYERIAKTVIELGHVEELTSLGRFRKVEKVDLCPHRVLELERSYELCLTTAKGNYRITLSKNIQTVRSIEEFGKLALDFRAFVKTRDIISGIFVFFIVFITLLTLLSTVWLAILVARRLSEPIEELSQKARKLAAGDFDVDIEVKRTGDEIESLFLDFKSMRDNLRDIYTQLQRERDLLSKLFDSIPVGVAYVSREGKPEKVNDTFRKLYGKGEVSEEKLRSLESKNLRWQKIDTQEGSIYILEDIQPIILAERFKIWQEAVKRIAHEIKNPLTPIRLNLERIYRLLSKEDVDVEKIREIIQTILKEIDRINNLIRQFRNISSERKLNKAHLSLSRLLDEVKALYANAGIHVEVIGEVKVQADYASLKEVFYNLINNSIEWRATEVKIRLHEDRIEFEDNGEGMDKEELENIFTPHFSKNPKGMGVGMATVKKIIEDHGWKIEAYSRRGEGLKLIIRF